MPSSVLIIEDDDLKGRTMERFVRVVGDREVFRVHTLKQALFVIKGRPLAVITDWVFPFEDGDPPRKNGHVVTALCHDMGIPCLVNSGHDPVDDIPPGTLWPSFTDKNFNEVLTKFLNDLPRAPT